MFQRSQRVIDNNTTAFSENEIEDVQPKFSKSKCLQFLRMNWLIIVLSFVILFIGFALSILSFFHFMRRERVLLQKDLENQANSTLHQILQSLQNKGQILKALKAFHFGSSLVDYKEFIEFNKLADNKANNMDLIKLEWLPIVPFKNLTSFMESAVRINV